MVQSPRTQGVLTVSIQPASGHGVPFSTVSQNASSEMRPRSLRDLSRDLARSLTQRAQIPSS